MPAFDLLVQCAVSLVLLAASAMFSGSETVLFSLSRTALERAAASQQPLTRRVATLMARPKDVLAAILVGNTAANTLLFVTAFIVIKRLSAGVGDWIEPLAGAGCVMVVVVVAEVTPKVVGVALAERLAPFAALYVSVCLPVLAPVGRLIDAFIVMPFERVILGRPKRAHSKHDVSPEELTALLELSRREGVINRIENLYLNEVFRLSELRVHDVMVARVDVVSFNVRRPASELRALMRQTGRKKIPVYDGSPDNIIGLIYAKVLFFAGDVPLRPLVAAVRFVPEIITCEQLLQHFRETRSQFAVAVDEFGGVAGVVTLEDVLESIVGDISAPHELTEPDEIIRLSPREYDISGRLSVHYWAEVFGTEPLEQRVATVGGVVTARLGRPAQPGDKVRFGNIEAEVSVVRGQRIERVRVRLLGAEAPPAAEAPA